MQYITRINFEPGTINVLKAYARKNGMTQVAVLSRLMEWYAGQPATIQTLMLLPEALRDDGDVARRIVRGLANGRGSAAQPRPSKPRRDCTSSRPCQRRHDRRWTRS
jgi:hypothetical protein